MWNGRRTRLQLTVAGECGERYRVGKPISAGFRHGYRPVRDAVGEQWFHGHDLPCLPALSRRFTDVCSACSVRSALPTKFGFRASRRDNRLTGLHDICPNCTYLNCGVHWVRARSRSRPSRMGVRIRGSRGAGRRCVRRIGQGVSARSPEEEVGTADGKGDRDDQSEGWCRQDDRDRRSGGVHVRRVRAAGAAHRPRLADQPDHH